MGRRRGGQSWDLPDLSLPKAVVGFLEVTLAVEFADSLKAKRSVVRSIVEKTRHRFNAAVAEVGEHDVLSRARIGVTVVANDAAFANSMLDKILDSIEDQAVGRAEIVGQRLELLHV